MKLARTVLLLTLAAFCPAVFAARFSSPKNLGRINIPKLDEASGIATSIANPGILYLQNDSGPVVVYAVNTSAGHIATIKLKKGKNYDCEDLATGPGPDPNLTYIYLADIGDNNHKRDFVTVYRFPEPALNSTIDPNQTPADIRIDKFDVIRLRYPTGPVDAETLMLDPVTGDLYILSKENSVFRIFRASFPQNTSNVTTMHYEGSSQWYRATAGDISPDGSKIIVRSHFFAAFWNRQKDEPLHLTLQSPPENCPLTAEPQGEAICFDSTSGGYYTTSEKKNQPLYYFAPIEKMD